MSYLTDNETATKIEVFADETSAAQAAATQAFLAASPEVSGITGEHWTNCKIVPGNELLQDNALARRLWDVSQELLGRQRRIGGAALQQAA